VNASPGIVASDTGSVSSSTMLCESPVIHFRPSPVPVDFTNRRTPMLVIRSTRTPYLSGSSCVDRNGSRYLVSLTRPRIDLACPPALAGESDPRRHKDGAL
jgi:hypothetical protein